MNDELALIHKGLPKGEKCQISVQVSGDWPKRREGEGDEKYLNRVRSTLIKLGLITGKCSGCGAEMVVPRGAFI